jgi:hypothetical protein
MVSTPSSANEDLRHPRCWECDYDLTGLPGATRCPECGWSIDWKRAYHRRALLVLSRRVLTILLIAVAVMIPVQVFCCSSGRVVVAIMGTHDGVSLIPPFRRIYNSITLLQGFGLCSTLFLVIAIWVSARWVRKTGMLLTVFASTVVVAGGYIRWFLQRERMVGWFSWDIALGVGCAAVYLLVRRRLAWALKHRDE